MIGVVRCGIFALFSAIVCSSLPANAQSPIELDRIDVDAARGTAAGPVQGYVATQSATGTKTDTPVIETPQSMTVIGTEQMQAQGAKTVEQAVTYSAGVKGEAYGFNPIYSGINIRGFETFSLFRDGLAQHSDMQVEPFGLERVEVLRGPASILYGQNPPGGVVNLVTKHPTADPFFTTELTYGTFNRKEVGVDAGGRIDKEGHWLYRFTALGRLSDTQVDFVNDDRLYVAPALTWAPTTDTTLTILANYQRDRTKFVPDVPAEGSLLPNPNGKIRRDVYLGSPDFDAREVDVASIGYLFEHRLNESLTLKQNLRWSRADTKYRWTFGYTDYNAFNGRLVDRYSVDEFSVNNRFTVDNQAIYKFQHGNVAHTFLSGVDYLQRRTRGASSDSFDTGPFFTDIFDPDYSGPPPLLPYDQYWQSQRQIGIYLQDQIKVGDRWIVLLGGRKDLAWATNEARNFVIPPDTDDRTYDEAFTGRAGLMYQTPSGLAPYVSYSESFEPVDTGIRVFGGGSLKPVTGRQYEGGLKYQPTPKYLITLALFDIEQQNVTTEDPVNGPRFVVQRGTVTSRGLELEANAEFGPWRLIGSYTYLDTRITADTDPTVVGNWLDGVPRHMANGWAEYKFTSGFLEGFGLGAGVRFTDKSFNSDNRLSIPSHTIVDALLSYERDKTRIALNVRNLFDEDYVKWCGAYMGVGGFTRCRFGEARTVMLSLKQTW